jgi:hypothetical protein
MASFLSLFLRGLEKRFDRPAVFPLSELLDRRLSRRHLLSVVDAAPKDQEPCQRGRKELNN